MNLTPESNWLRRKTISPRNIADTNTIWIVAIFIQVMHLFSFRRRKRAGTFVRTAFLRSFSKSLWQSRKKNREISKKFGIRICRANGLLNYLEDCVQILRGYVYVFLESCVVIGSMSSPIHAGSINYALLSLLQKIWRTVHPFSLGAEQFELTWTRRPGMFSGIIQLQAYPTPRSPRSTGYPNQRFSSIRSVSSTG